MRKIITILMFCLLVSPVFADENSSFSGDITVKGKLTSIDGNEAKFNEFRDVNDGVYGSIKLNYDTDSYFLNFKANNIGYDDQYYKLYGGAYDKFKYYLNYNEIPHNYTFKARTLYLGAGTDHLVYPTHPPTTVLQNWNEFDYYTKRKEIGAGFSLDLIKPFSFGVSYKREIKEGILPTGSAGTTPGGIGLELPYKVDNMTDTLLVNLDYSKKPFFASLMYQYSEFENDVTNLFFRNPASIAASNQVDVVTLSPDNIYHKISFKGKVMLPLNSSFNFNIGSSNTKSEVGLFPYYVTAAGSTAITLSDMLFDGRVRVFNYGAVLTSNPVKFLDAKVYYKYYEKKNESDQIFTRDGATIFGNHLFDYKKNNYGLDLGFKLPANFYLNLAYSFTEIDRDRGDAPKNEDNLYSATLRWNGLDFLTAKVGFERLHRDVDHKIPTLVTGDQNQANIVEQYVRRFDVARVDMDSYKADFDITPFDNLTIGLGAKYKKANYEEVSLGLRTSRINEYNFDVDYTPVKMVKINAYYDYEKIRYDQFQRRYPALPAGNPYPFVGLQNATNYNWLAEPREKTYDYGVGVDVYAIPKKLTFRLQHDYVKSDGFADFTYYNTAALVGGRNNENIDIRNFDDYRKRAYMLKAIYEFSKNISCSLGWAYEKYVYQDVQVDGYIYVPATTGTNGAYLTGFGKDPSYTANVYFASLTYRF